MKSFIAVLALVAVVAADVSHVVPHGSERDAEVVRQESDVSPVGFKFAFATSNGITGEEQGNLRQIGEDEALTVVGSNSYTAPTGEQFVLTFEADENGYRPQGAHLPTPPPPQEIPEYIKRSLAYIAEHTVVEKQQARF